MVLENKKINLEDSLKILEEKHKQMLITNNEKKFMNELDKNKRN